MATDPEFLDHVLDLFSGLGPLRTGRMFSGTALYAGDAMVAAILGDIVWMKSDATTEVAFLAAGSRPFSYMRKTGPRTARGLMSLPDAALDDADEALRWARLSLGPATAAAQRRAGQKARKTRRPPAAPDHEVG